MICYKSRTYCAAETCAKFARCDRAFTNEIRQKAKEAKLPVSIVQKMECYEENNQPTNT